MKRELDRDDWPPPERNPLIHLLRRDEEWITNKELADALGFLNKRGNKSVVGHWKDILDELPEDTKMLDPPSDRFHSRVPVRVFTKKALIWIALRARTTNARAFQDWLTARAAELEVWNG